MGRLNNLYIRVFNSPKNFDEISHKKTKSLLLQTIVLAIFGWIVFFIIVLKDAATLQTNFGSEIQNTTQLPYIAVETRYTNIDSLSLNQFNINQDFNSLNYSKYFYCIGLQESTCYNNWYNLSYYYYENSNSFFEIRDNNITFNETYFNINFQSPNVSNDENGILTAGWKLYLDDIVYSFTGPIKVQVILKKEIMIDDKGVKSINFIPNIVTSMLSTNSCQSYMNGSIIDNCISNTVSIFYQSNIVAIYTLENLPQFLLRLGKDTFSINKLVLTLLSLFLSFFITKFFFKKRTSWFDNSIRDAVLYHFHYHEIDKSENFKNKEDDYFDDKTIKDKSRKDRTIKDSEMMENLIDNGYGNENNGISKKFNSLKNIIKKMLRNIDLQDRYSKKLSLLTKIQFLVLVIILLGIFSFIFVDNIKYSLININYIQNDEVELPPFNFSYKSSNISESVYWAIFYDNYYNDYCSKANINEYLCFGSDGLHPYNTTVLPFNATIPDFLNANAHYGLNEKIKLKKDQQYTMAIGSFVLDKNNTDQIYIRFNLNDILYYLKPYQNITIQLTQTTFIQDSNTNITTYEPSIISSPFNDSVAISKQLNSIAGVTIINIEYSTNIVKEIKMETLFQKLVRIATYCGAFVSPTMTIVTFLFTKIISKFLYKNSSTHVEFNTREAILYHLNNFKKYKPIFKRNTNDKKSQEEYRSSEIYKLK